MTNNKDYNQNIVNFRNTQLKKKLLKRGESAGAIADRDLNRYYQLLENDPVYLQVNQAMLLADLFNGTLYDPGISPRSHLHLSLLDALPGYYAEKWGVDLEVLIEKIQGLDDIEAMSIIDRIERFWCEPASEEEPEYNVGDTLEKLKQVELVDPKSEDVKYFSYRFEFKNDEDAIVFSENIDKAVAAIIADQQIQLHTVKDSNLHS